MSGQLLAMAAIPQEKTVGGLVDPRASLGTEEDKNLLPMPGIEQFICPAYTLVIVLIMLPWLQ